MREVRWWGARVPRSRDLRFAMMRWLDQRLPSVCRGISVSLQQANFLDVAACVPETTIEVAEEPFPTGWQTKLEQDLVSEYGSEGRVSQSARLELQYATCNDAWIFGHTGQIVEASTNRSITPVNRGSTVPRRLKARKLDGVGFSLLTGRPGYRKNYYHFLTERLPEYLMALSAAVDTFGQVTLLLPASDHPLETALVSEAQRRFPELPVRRVELSEKVRCEAVVMHRVRRSSIYRSPASRRLLSDAVEAMRQSFSVFPTAKGTRRLFVSRSDAKKRRLTNEDEVFARLNRFGFDLVTPGRLSVRDQIALFSEAKVVVGPHGAGMTNIMFMPIGGSVIEIFRPDSAHGTHAWLSHLGRHAHGYVISNETTRNFDYRLTGKALDAFERQVGVALERLTEG